MQSKENQDPNTERLVQPTYIAISPEQFGSNQNKEDEIDLAELWRAIWAGKLTILLVTMLFAVASVVYAINQPNIYRASVLLAPASNEGGLAALAGQFGGLASMAGITLGSAGSDKNELALQVLKSRVFLESFIEKNSMKIPLMAVEKWDRKTDSLIYDKDVYDIDTKEWVRDVSFPQLVEPSAWETFEEFKDILSVSSDRETGMVTISIEYYSPHMASIWLTKLVEDINENMRNVDKQKARNSINFLTKKLEQTSLADMKTVFFQLIEEQMKTMMLAEVSEELTWSTKFRHLS